MARPSNSASPTVAAVGAASPPKTSSGMTLVAAATLDCRTLRHRTLRRSSSITSYGSGRFVESHSWIWEL